VVLKEKKLSEEDHIKKNVGAVHRIIEVKIHVVPNFLMLDSRTKGKRTKTRTRTRVLEKTNKNYFFLGLTSTFFRSLQDMNLDIDVKFIFKLLFSYFTMQRG
jgi:hypothetical protein